VITWQLRGRLRDEVLRREAEGIHAVALMHLQRGESQLAEFGADFAMDDMFAAVLESSKLGGVISVQLFDAKGALKKSSTPPPDETVAPVWWARDLSQPEAKFIPDGSLDMAAPAEALRRGAK